MAIAKFYLHAWRLVHIGDFSGGELAMSLLIKGFLISSNNIEKISIILSGPFILKLFLVTIVHFTKMIIMFIGIKNENYK